MNDFGKRKINRRLDIIASIVLCHFFFISIHSQVLHHQMIASIVSSKVINNGLSVHQSIGQLSMSGTYSSATVSVQQGFQQSRKFVKVESKPLHNAIITTVYPNPVRDYVNFQFSSPVKGKITIMLFDTFGRLILRQEKTAVSHTLVTIEALSGLPDGQYIVQLMSSGYKFSSKLIKRK